MICMRKLSYEFKIPGRSIPEVYERFNRALTRHKSAGKVKFSGRKLSAEAMTNAVVLSFLDLTEAQQEQVLARYVPRFEAMLADEPAAGIPGLGNDVGGMVADAEAEAKSRRRRDGPA